LISVVRNGCARRVFWIARDTPRRSALSRAAQDAAESVPQSRDASEKEAGADISRKRWQRDRLPHGCGPKRPPEEVLWPRASPQFGSVIGLEQRVEKPTEFFLVRCGNPFDCVGSEITIHGAAEEHAKLAKNLGIMRETGLRKAEEVVQVAGVAAVDHGFDLSAKDFLGGEDEKLARRRADGGRGREHSRRESAKRASEN